MDFLRKSISTSAEGMGILAIFLEAEIVSDLNLCSEISEKVGIYTGVLGKGIRTMLDFYFPNGWIIYLQKDGEINLSEKSHITNFLIDNGYLTVGSRNRVVLESMPIEIYCRILKEYKFTGKLNLERAGSVYKLYEALDKNPKVKLEAFYSLKIPLPIIESSLLTFINKAKNWEEYNGSNTTYALMLKSFKERNPLIDKVLIEYAVKSNKFDITKDRLLWLLLKLK